MSELFEYTPLFYDLSTDTVRPEGLEPPTVGLKGHCSAIELRALNTEHLYMFLLKKAIEPLSAYFVVYYVHIF